jgi:hypothetical protein
MSMNQMWGFNERHDEREPGEAVGRRALGYRYYGARVPATFQRLQALHPLVVVRNSIQGGNQA